MTPVHVQISQLQKYCMSILAHRQPGLSGLLIVDNKSVVLRTEHTVTIKCPLVKTMLHYSRPTGTATVFVLYQAVAPTLNYLFSRQKLVPPR